MQRTIDNMSKEDEFNENMRQIKKALNSPIYPDFDFINLQNQTMANSAREFQKIQEKNNAMFQEIAEQHERRDNAIQQTAQASIEHTKLLEKQLEEAKTQNVTLNDLYEQAKKEAEENKAELQISHEATEKAHRLSIWAIVLSSVFSALGIAVSILIALYL